jgi:hypothetical protein
LKRNISLFGENHVQIASNHQAIANAYFVSKDFKLALEHQEKSHLIAKQLMPEDSEYLINSKHMLNKYMQFSI